MATTVKVMVEQKRARYSAEYRAEALSLVERVDIAAAASEVRLYANQICHLSAHHAGLAVLGSGHRSLYPQGDWLGEQSTN